MQKVNDQLDFPIDTPTDQQLGRQYRNEPDPYKQCNRLCILDHHKTAAEDLDGIFEHPKVDGRFDMERSGAMMAWDWFHMHRDCPLLIAYVQDRDLWRFEIEGTREVMASDAGNILCKGEAFAALWYSAKDGTHHSLRSDENGVDVSKIAEQYGGGGHKHAAGFVLPHGEEL